MNGVNMQQFMQEAKRVQKELRENRDRMENEDFVGTAVGGGVKVTLNGILQAKRVYISPELFDGEKENLEIVQDALVVAFNNAKDKINAENNDVVNSLIGAR
jgi:DNA-binding protein YbaB